MINVATFKGFVQRHCFEISKEDEDKAVEVSRSVRFVKSIENDLRLK